jgi:hypothetical protein
MNVYLSECAIEQLADAPMPVQRAFIQQINFLVRNLRHPGLHARKYDETERFARQAIKETQPNAKTTGLGLARLPQVRHAAHREQAHFVRASHTQVMTELQAYELQRRRLEDELAAAQAA